MPRRNSRFIAWKGLGQTASTKADRTVGGRGKRKLARDFVADLPAAFAPFRKASSQDCGKPNLAGLNQLQRRKEPFRSHPCRFPDGIVDITKKRFWRSFNRTPCFGREKRPYGLLPELPQLWKHIAKGLNSVMHVEQILFPVGRRPPVMDQKFLHGKRYRIWDLNNMRLSCRKPSCRADPNLPGRGQKQFKVPQLLRGYPGNGSGRIAPAALVHTADERRREFRIKASVTRGQSMMNCWRPRVPKKFLLKPACSQAK